MTVASDKKISLGPYTSKIHKEELLELLDLWEFGPGVKEKIGAVIEAEAEQLKGPHLFRYYNPRPSKVAAAEKAFAEFLGVKHVLAVNSCTSALIAALRALGIGMGDEVIVPAYTFFASAAAIGASQRHPGHRRRGRHADPRSEGRGAQDHAAHAGDHRRPHARQTGADG